MIIPAFQDNKEKHAKHRTLNFDIHSALDATKFGIVLDDLVHQGMPPEMVEIYKAQFEALLAGVSTENNRLTSWMPLNQPKKSYPNLD
ncbi:MAG: hypothetical protein ACKVJE_17155 [Pseudomonadales bacterium]